MFPKVSFLKFVLFYENLTEQCIRRGNEIYGYGSACQKTCDDLKPGAEPKMCILALVESCYCPEDKVRSVEGGECIDPSDCPQN